MERYVVGFLFSEDNESVLLIRKNKPDWQKGKLNGVGGKIEENETEDDAMVREFKEETNLVVEDWSEIAILSMDDLSVYFYSSQGNLAEARAMTNESLEIVRVDELSHKDTIYNLKWLIPLCLEMDIYFPLEVKLRYGMKRPVK